MGRLSAEELEARILADLPVGGGAAPGFKHEIVETIVEDGTQTVRCACGRSAMFARERDYYGAPKKRARSIAEFVCTGEAITLRLALIREVP